MKTTRPVFESFNAFVSFINEAEAAAMSIEDFLRSNSSFFDSDAKKAFDAMKIAATRAPLSNEGAGAKLMAKAGSILKNMDDNIKVLISENNDQSQGKWLTRMVEKTTTEIKKVIYPALINGKVALTSTFYSPLGIKTLEASLSGGKLVDINDLVTSMNLTNLDNTDSVSGLNYPTVVPDSRKGRWAKYTEDYTNNSGACMQNVITSIASGINIANNENAIPGDQAKIITELDFVNKNAGKTDAEKAQVTFVLYGVGNIVQGAGDTVPATLVKKDFTTTIVPGKSEPYQVPIDGGDAMFEQGSAKINDKNKEAIDKMLTAALAPLAGKPESIVIRGGASYEPDGQGPINKQLVVDRANAVKTHLEKLYPELKDLITVKPDDIKDSKIQAKDEPKEYEKFRKVYLDITGVLQGASYKKNEEIEYLVDGVINADTVEIIQYAITFEFYKEKEN
jgi:outer membrane protein OmpA-like peptidoglycan-associated protein